MAFEKELKFNEGFNLPLSQQNTKQNKTTFQKIRTANWLDLWPDFKKKIVLQ